MSLLVYNETITIAGSVNSQGIPRYGTQYFEVETPKKTENNEEIRIPGIYTIKFSFLFNPPIITVTGNDNRSKNNIFEANISDRKNNSFIVKSYDINSSYTNNGQIIEDPEEYIPSDAGFDFIFVTQVIKNPSSL